MNIDPDTTRPPTRGFLVTLALTLAVNGLWAGAVTFRVLLDLPARRRIGPLAFAEFSKATDLAAGLVVYPMAAIVSAILCGVTWFIAARTSAPRAVRVAVTAASVCALLVLGMTTQAAPIMFRIGSAPPDPELLAGLADRFATWTNLRAVSADLAAAALLYALTACALQGSRAGERT